MLLLNKMINTHKTNIKQKHKHIRENIKQNIESHQILLQILQIPVRIFASVNLLSVITKSDGGFELAIFIQHVSDAVVSDGSMQTMHVAVSEGRFHDGARS